MATSNRDRVNKGMDLLKEGLYPPVAQMMQGRYGDRWWEQYKIAYPQVRANGPEELDVQGLLHMMRNGWRDVFGVTLGNMERNLVHELIEARNLWAHQQPFSTDDTERALDSMARLLRAVSAAEQADEIERERQIVRRTQFAEFARTETRKAATAAVATQASTGLRPWREIITPHRDVQLGNFKQAEFAADLAQVVRGEGAPEYVNPIEFFRRTYLTEGLSSLLKNALLRLSGVGGDPVIELQTNFGGGKTHSMLALYHLANDIDFERLRDFEPILAEVRATGATIPVPKTAVLVGTALSPGQVRHRGDGTEIHTLWGEMAYQLLGRRGYAIIADSDKAGQNPGSDLLAQLFHEAGPSLILIDEWVAFVRALYHQSGNPAGSFDANLSFAQSLTEAVRQTPQTLLVASLPASDIEIGGEGGREALARLRNTFNRMQTSWRPATTEEGFEIVRRRLFEDIGDHSAFAARDAVIRAYGTLYERETAQFPRKVQEGDYRRRLETAYPIHPELFDQLYDRWSTLDTFQRTRGVLRLMATVIHILWTRQDSGLLIMPASVPMDAGSVIDELTHYVDVTWRPVIERDVDGEQSLPILLDKENPNFGRLSAARRVARTLFLGTAPTANVANRGIEDRDIKLGCAQPGESIAIFGDALRSLSDRATHLYVDHGKYWFSTQPSVTRTAQDRADRLSLDEVYQEVVRRIRQQNERGDFVRVHACPAGSSDVRDELTVGLVILDPEHQHTRSADDSAARQQAESMLAQRGDSPRLNRNTLVFAAADKAKWTDLEAAVRQYLAWKSIHDEADQLNLDAFQRNQATSKQKDTNTTVDARLADTYQWILCPRQESPQSRTLEWDELRTMGDGQLAKRVSQRLRNDGILHTRWNGVSLRQWLDKVPLWRGDHVQIRELASFFAQYLYLDKLKNDQVLLEAIAEGLNNSMWMSETFAVASSYDATTSRYHGLVHGQHRLPTLDQLLVKAEVVLRQIELPPPGVTGPTGPVGPTGPIGPTGLTGATLPPPPPPPDLKPRRYYAQVRLNPEQVSKDIGDLSASVLQHLVGVLGANVSVMLEIEANAPDGFSEDVRRTVDENSRTLKFEQHGFEVS